MPELPEVETVRRGLEPVMVGRRFTAVQQRRPDLRFPFPPDFVQRLTGRKIQAMTRRAKYILTHLDDVVKELRHVRVARPARVVEEDEEIAAKTNPQEPQPISPWD